jgi:hypothetical protein
MRSLNLKMIFFSFLSAMIFTSPAWAGKWYEHVSQMKVYTNKINDSERKIRELIHEKNETSDISKKQTLNTEMFQEHNDLVETYKKYNELRYHMKYEHPEKGEIVDRRYLAMRAKTIDELEKEIGLQGRLTQLKKKIDEKYAPFIQKDKAAHPPVEAVHEEVPVAPEPVRPRLVK